MEVEGSTTFSIGGNCCYVGRERPWRVLESSTRIQSCKSISVVWVDEMVGAGGYKFIEILCILFRRAPSWRIFGPDLVARPREHNHETPPRPRGEHEHLSKF